MNRETFICGKCKLHNAYNGDNECGVCKARRLEKMFNKKLKKNKSKKFKTIRTDLRKAVFSVFPKACMKCKTTKKIMHVDHIKPVSKFKWLEYDLLNCQVLCEYCNISKGNRNEIDYREDYHKKNMYMFMRSLNYSHPVVIMYLSHQKKYENAIKMFNSNKQVSA